jgi:hypothetical protein
MSDESAGIDRSSPDGGLGLSDEWGQWWWWWHVTC